MFLLPPQNTVACDQLVEDFEELKKDLATFLLRFSDGDSLAYLGSLNV